MILQISEEQRNLCYLSIVSDEQLQSMKKRKRLAKTSKTGLKLHQKLLPFPSPEQSEQTGYRKSYLAKKQHVCPQ